MLCKSRATKSHRSRYTARQMLHRSSLSMYAALRAPAHATLYRLGRPSTAWEEPEGPA